MKEIQVIDGAINPYAIAQFQQSITAPWFSWYLTDVVKSDNMWSTVRRKYYNMVKDYHDDVKESEQFVHTLIMDYKLNSDAYETFKLLTDVLDIAMGQDIDISRMKINLTTRKGEEYRNKISSPHLDNPEFVDGRDWIAIYYINDSDGETIIFNQTNEFLTNPTPFTPKMKIQPTAGRMIIFPAKYYHSAGWPVENDYRSVVNINFSIEFPEDLVLD